MTTAITFAGWLLIFGVWFGIAILITVLVGAILGAGSRNDDEQTRQELFEAEWQEFNRDLAARRKRAEERFRKGAA